MRCVLDRLRVLRRCAGSVISTAWNWRSALIVSWRLLVRNATGSSTPYRSVCDSTLVPQHYHINQSINQNMCRVPLRPPYSRLPYKPIGGWLSFVADGHWDQETFGRWRISKGRIVPIFLDVGSTFFQWLLWLVKIKFRHSFIIYVKVF